MSNIAKLKTCARKRVLACLHLQTRPFSSNRIQPNSPTEHLSKALRVLDVLGPRKTSPPRSTVNNTHLRLIQEFLRTDCVQVEDEGLSRRVGGSSKRAEEKFGFRWVIDAWAIESGESGIGDSGYDPGVLSTALSSNALIRDLRAGLGYHCVAVRIGLVADSYVGSCLVTLYVKCGELGCARKVFDEMPNRNVVTWTAIISGFAQEMHVAECLELYSMMRKSMTKPNDFTFSSLLSACTGSGALGQGRGVHCQVIRMGFDRYCHVGNALVSMYCKCGSLGVALNLFDNMIDKDVVSWNSMIAGYALHGLAVQAIGLFEKMKCQGLRPDAITFLGILSSCRHAGLVEEGRSYFDSMVEYGVKPGQDHYSCLVDLLGRCGLIQEAQDVIEGMPIQPNAIIWGSLLSSCRLHRNVWIGIQAAESRLLLEPTCAATHIMLLNLYASVKCWDRVARMRKLMKDRGVRTNPGCSWIEINNNVYRFRAEDGSNARSAEILAVVKSIAEHMSFSNHEPNARDKLAVTSGIG